MINETQVRTITKAILYRILSVIAIILLSLAFGASSKTAGLMGLIVVVIGTTIYYIHERLWIKTSWARDFEGYDDTKRSIIKTIIYRALTLIAGFIVARIVLTDSNANAVAFTVAQSVTNMILFYLMERIFNRIAWGKILNG